jgi:hypothetical protein
MRDRETGYLAVVYDMASVPCFLSCEHGKITVFTTRREAERAVRSMREQASFLASGEVIKMKLYAGEGLC